MPAPVTSRQEETHMTRFWCPWCGENGEGETPEDRIQCMRCVSEFWQLFGFWPEAAMVPLEDRENPGEPEAARKRFTFRTPEGDVLGTTWSPPARARRTG